jgi:hypothetical protein
MKHRVQWLVALATLLAATLLAAVSDTASAAARSPTGAQIRSAIRRAERSRDLWATINICNTQRYPNTVGIRGQMPTLGFDAQLGMEIGVDYYSAADKAFKPVPGAQESIPLGTVRSGLQQGGVRFPLSPHPGTLRGSVKFEWRLGRQLLGRTTRTTKPGHRDADFGDPPRYSNETCVIH